MRRVARRAVRRIARHAAACAALPAAVWLAGCAQALPQAWEKGLLARPDMALDADALEQRSDEHVYTSREAASGRGAAGGAGCGCN